MIYLDNLIKVLKEWDSEAGMEKEMELNALVSTVLLQLGNEAYVENYKDQNYITKLEERINHLVYREGMSEEFLVNGTLDFISSWFNDAINKREESITNNEKMLSQAKSMGLGEEFTKDTETKIAFLKSDEYVYLAKNQKDIWEKVRGEIFSKENIRKMDIEMSYQDTKRFKEQMSPEERVRFNAMLDKLNNR